MMHCHPRRPASRICQAGHYANQLVQEFFDLEYLTGLRTRGVATTSGFRVQEETVTETMILKLEAAFPDVVAVETYTRANERATGADWFWIFDFGGTLVPVLIQAKKIEEPWDGTDVWSIKFNESQRKKLETTATAWNVGWQFCLYAPCLNGWQQSLWPCTFPWFRTGHIHLMEATTSRNGSVPHKSICDDMLPFTCWCCCSDSADDAERVLGVSRQKFREGDNALRELLRLAQETQTVKGSVVLTMKGDGRG
jgi:hypothetical protein